jgi:hypothetical protein
MTRPSVHDVLDGGYGPPGGHPMSGHARPPPPEDPPPTPIRPPPVLRAGDLGIHRPLSRSGGGDGAELYAGKRDGP